VRVGIRLAVARLWWLVGQVLIRRIRGLLLMIRLILLLLGTEVRRVFGVVYGLMRELALWRVVLALALLRLLLLLFVLCWVDDLACSWISRLGRGLWIVGRLPRGML
jgi:hypothetical protein